MAQDPSASESTVVHLPWMFERIGLVNHRCLSQVFIISYCWNHSVIGVLSQLSSDLWEEFRSGRADHMPTVKPLRWYSWLSPHVAGTIEHVALGVGKNLGNREDNEAEWEVHGSVVDKYRHLSCATSISSIPLRSCVIVLDSNYFFIDI